jgi:hypothetical protein
MRYTEFIIESPALELAKRLPSLRKHNYNTIDQLTRSIAKKHNLSHKALNDLFVKTYHSTPDQWINGKLDEDTKDELDIQQEVDKFAQWAGKKLNIKSMPEIELSMDTEEAQTNHHTGGHVEGSGSIWVYANNRNLVDMLRTVVHELTHVRQGELGMIKPGDSYPGSPIELLADMVAGKLIKQYGEKNHHIFQ